MNADPDRALRRVLTTETILAAQRQLVEDAMARHFADLLDPDDYTQQAVALTKAGES
jgi:hypothetical protein